MSLAPGAGLDEGHRDYDDMLAEMVHRGASDLYLAANAEPSVLVDGTLQPIDSTPLNEKEMIGIARSRSGASTVSESFSSNSGAGDLGTLRERARHP